MNKTFYILALFLPLVASASDGLLLGTSPQDAWLLDASSKYWRAVVTYCSDGFGHVSPCTGGGGGGGGGGAVTSVQLPPALGPQAQANSLSVVPATGSIQPISATALPLPTGAATSAAQTSAQTSLGAIQSSVGNIPPLGQALAAASVPAVLPLAQITALTPPTTVTVVQPTGTNLHAVIDSVKAPVNSNGSFQTASITTTESNISAPANAVGVYIQPPTTNATTIQWAFSNSATAILSTTTGSELQAGRSSGKLEFGTGTVLHLIAAGAGTNTAAIQWILSQ